LFTCGFLLASVRSDVVFIQKRLLPLALLKSLRLFGLKTIYDFDDALYALPPSKLPAQLKRRLEYQLTTADMIVAGNDTLASYAVQFNTNVTVIPSCVELRDYDRSRHADDAITIGWIGTSGNFVHLQLVERALAAILQLRPQTRILIVSDKDWSSSIANVVNRRWQLETAHEYFEQIDIGIMPLRDTPYARGKCAYKALEFMAAQIPVVVSPVGMSAAVVHDGVNGFTAIVEDEWSKKIIALIDSADLRYWIGGAGRRTVEQHFTAQSGFDGFLRTLQNVLTTTDSRPRRAAESARSD
jgi:glycosyltransferase involved in cell wall biosynthesis